MKREYDSDDNTERTNGTQSYFVIERPIEELPAFQSHIYRVYGPISVQENILSDDISHRCYYGKCQFCNEDHYLGTVVMKCHDAIQLYARIQ